MSGIKVSLHPENIPLYANDVPYVKEYADGSVDYCLGASYESAGQVIRALIEVKDERMKKESKEKMDELPD